MDIASDLKAKLSDVIGGARKVEPLGRVGPKGPVTGPKGPEPAPDNGSQVPAAPKKAKPKAKAKPLSKLNKKLFKVNTVKASLVTKPRRLGYDPLAEARAGKVPSPPELREGSSEAFKEIRSELIKLGKAKDAKGLREYQMNSDRVALNLYRSALLVSLKKGGE